MNAFAIISQAIERQLEKGNRDFAIYPFGEMGVQAKQILNIRYGINEKGIFDNKVCQVNDAVRPLEEAAKKEYYGVIFLILCKNDSLRREVLPLILKYVPKSQIVDVFGGENNLIGRNDCLRSISDIVNVVKNNKRIPLFQEALRRNLLSEGISVEEYIPLPSLMNLYDSQFIPKGRWKDCRRVKARLDDLYDNLDKYCHVYYLLTDQLSRSAYIDNLSYRLFADFQDLHETEIGIPQYFNALMPISNDEVFVDCGAYTGDTIRAFVSRYGGKFRHIYAFEPSRESFIALKDTCTKLALSSSNVTLMQRAVLDKSREVKFALCGDGSHVTDNEMNEVVAGISLDEVIAEPISLIKMDIEGSEFDAIQGAKEHIKNDTPKMAICLYHCKEDFWKLPLAVLKINPKYDLFIRHHSNTIWDYVLYCVPKK